MLTTSTGVPEPSVALAILKASNALSSIKIASASSAEVASGLTTKAFALSISALNSSAPFLVASYDVSTDSILAARAEYSAAETRAFSIEAVKSATAFCTSASVEVVVISLPASIADFSALDAAEDIIV